MDAAHDGSEVSERGRGRVASLGEQPRGTLRIGLEHLLGQAERHAERDQTGLGAVVEVTLDAAQLGRGVVDALGPALGDVRDSLLELVT